MFEKVVLFFDRFEAPAFERGTLGMLDRILDGPLAIGVTHARRVSHYAVVREHRGVDRIELRLVQVGLDDAFLQIVQHHVAGGATEIPPSLLVQPGPCLLAGLPHHAPKAAP